MGVIYHVTKPGKSSVWRVYHISHSTEETDNPNGEGV